MGIEEKLPSGLLLTSVEKMAGWARGALGVAGHLRPGLLRHRADSRPAGPKHDLARFGMERASNTPRQADLMIVAGRLSQKMAPVTRQIYDQMSDPKWVISMGVCASSGGMFNNYAIVQGVTTSSRWISTCPAARRGRRCCSTRSSSCTTRS